MGNQVEFGRQIIDNGPCTDGQQANMGELANLLEQLGNPAPPLVGPIDPATGEVVPPGDVYNNVYWNGEGDLVIPPPVPGDPPIIVIAKAGS